MTEAAAQTLDAATDEPPLPKRSALTDMLGELADLWRVTLDTLFYTFNHKREKGAVITQCYAIGNRSLFFMVVTMGFIGAIVVYQIGIQTARIIPDMSLVGATYVKLLIRDLAASVGAMPLATRVGAGIAAEIGSMVVTEQTDALRMSAADPVDYLVVPRFLASVLMGTSILLIGGAVAYFAGMLICNLSFDVNPYVYMNFSMVTSGDCILGFIKCLVYGGTIALVSSQRGLRTFGGSEGVGRATTEAVVGSLFAIITLNLIMSTIGNFLLPA
ncbi:MAG: ABC transporter permease [Myxococcales bacterium]|nr:ABC transporter permease [Myxococcales bacterium]